MSYDPDDEHCPYAAPEKREAWKERAAIMIVDGGKDEQAAYEMARQCVEQEWKRRK